LEPFRRPPIYCDWKKSGREARMATGWAPDGAVQDQIDDTISDAVARARANMPQGESEVHCVECGEEIPEARRLALPGVRFCIACQSERDRKPVFTGINRRGSKDSQLK
jgi:phage/conjugal plasmid C-4 type zinc finger TraR family protein